MTTLIGIDRVKWSKLDTVEGKATNAPSILEGLASGEAKKAKAGVQWLFSEVLHQSTPAPSAITFVPFLIQLVELPKQPARWELLALLGDLACGGDHTRFIAGGDPASVDPKLHREVAVGRGAYLQCLADKSAKVRSAAAFVLAWLPDSPATKQLDAALAKEKDPTAKASMLLARGVLGSALAAAQPALEALKNGDALCWHHGDVGGLVMKIAMQAGDSSELLKLAFAPGGQRVMPQLIASLFPTKVDPKKLTETQRAFLDRITNAPDRYGAWGMAKLWESIGLPAQAGAARTVVGFAREQTRMDAALSVGGKSATFAAHYKQAVAEPPTREALARALAQGRGAEELVAHALEAAGHWHVGSDADGTVSHFRTLIALLDGGGDAVVPALRTVDIHTAVLDEEGNPATARALALPALHVLARRDKQLTAERLDKLAIVNISRAQDIAALLPMWLEAADALEGDRKIELLTRLYCNSIHDAKLPIMERMATLVHEDVSAVLEQHLKRIKQSYEYGRKYDNSEYSDGYPPALLKKTKAAEHPKVLLELEPIKRYIAVAKAAKHKPVAKLEKALAAVLAS